MMMKTEGDGEWKTFCLFLQKLGLLRHQTDVEDIVTSDQPHLFPLAPVTDKKLPCFKVKLVEEFS